MGFSFGKLINSIGDTLRKEVGDTIKNITGQIEPKGTNQTVLNRPPWEPPSSKNIDPLEKAFFGPYNIDPDRWNKLYPYRLIVVDVSETGIKIVGTTEVIEGAKQTRALKVKTTQAVKGIEYVLAQEVLTNSWVVNLPITPQQLQITDQFAINTTATMRGIVEEHNGIKFKIITASGTTGIWPTKPIEGAHIASPTITQSVLGGTIGAITQLVDNVSRVAKAFSGQHPNRPNSIKKPTDLDNERFSTGYYQALYLAQFLERYAMQKRKPENHGWRLIFDIPKQNQAFIVTPMTFNLRQDQSRPNEILFNMQLKAWKRIDLIDTQGIDPSDATGLDLDANAIQSLINGIREVRRTISSATNIIKAVRSDFQNIFNIYRQMTLAIKDLGGLVNTVVDFPSALTTDWQSIIVQSTKTLERGVFQRPSTRRSESDAGNFTQSAIALTAVSSAFIAGQIVNSILEKDKVHEGLSNDQVTNGALGEEAKQALETDPINKIFENPEENFDFFDEIEIDDLEFSPEQQQAVDEELERIQLLTIDDFRGFREELLSLALDISNNFGSGNQIYSDIYDIADPKTRAVPLTIEENEILAAIFESIQILDQLTATKQFDDQKIENPLEFVGGLADETGINFEQFPSKVPVPVPFGSTIEEIAARFMGDPDKWIEIVTVNKLRSPYIDEEGFIIEFLSNADGRQFNIPEPDSECDRLFIGQKIILQSDTVAIFSRKIINVEQISEGNILITVDGLDNLDNLTTADNARMQGFLPGTVNSQNTIFIPVNLNSQEDDRTFAIPDLKDPELTKISKVDLLLTDSGDIALNSLGDFRLANGLTNLIQAIKIKIRTQKGALLRHLDFGLGIEPGISVADIENGAIIESLNRMIDDDPRFDSVDRIQIRLDGSTLAIDMSIRIANGNGVLPISFDMNL